MAVILSKIIEKNRMKIGHLIDDHDLTKQRFAANSFFIKVYFLGSPLARLTSLHPETLTST